MLSYLTFLKAPSYINDAGRILVYKLLNWTAGTLHIPGVVRKPGKKMTTSNIRQKIKGTFRNIEFRDKETDDELHLEFSTDKNKDYNFYLWIAASWTTLNIGARLKNYPSLYFWYDSAEKLKMNHNEWEKWAVLTPYRLDRIII